MTVWLLLACRGQSWRARQSACQFVIASEARQSACQFVIASEARQSACQFVIASEARQSACQFVIARFAATQRYPKGTVSACWFVILSAVKDLNLRKQADCGAPFSRLKAKVIPAAGARSDGLAAHPLVITRQRSFQQAGAHSDGFAAPPLVISRQGSIPVAGARSDGLTAPHHFNDKSHQPRGLAVTESTREKREAAQRQPLVIKQSKTRITDARWG